MGIIFKNSNCIFFLLILYSISYTSYSLKVGYQIGLSNNSLKLDNTDEINLDFTNKIRTNQYNNDELNRNRNKFLVTSSPYQQNFNQSEMHIKGYFFNEPLYSNKEFYVYLNCNNKTCLNGECISLNECKCNPGWAQIDSTSPACSYKRKSQIIAFLFELIFVVGIGHLYSGRIIYGILKLMIFSVIIVLDIVFRWFKFPAFKNYFVKVYLNVTFMILYILLIIWHLIDLTMFAINHYTDGKGIQLYMPDQSYVFLT